MPTTTGQFHRRDKRPDNLGCAAHGFAGIGNHCAQSSPGTGRRVTQIARVALDRIGYCQAATEPVDQTV
jgi:hypothetical protein